MDVTDAASAEAAFGQILSEHGRIDILVNNAGITRDQLLMRMKREDWDRVLEVNLTGAFVCTQAVLRPMMKQRTGGLSPSARWSARRATPGSRTTRVEGGPDRVPASRSPGRSRRGTSRSTWWRRGSSTPT